MEIYMPQLQLPVFPKGVVEIRNGLGCQLKNGWVVYFYGTLPVAHHRVADLDSFKMYVAQFCEQGQARQMDIVRTFGVQKVSVGRWVQRYREKGPRGFFEPKRTRGAAVLTPTVVKQAQELFDAGHSRRDVAEKLGLKKNTVDKAVQAGRLHEPKKKSVAIESSPSLPVALRTSKSQRNVEDHVAPQGVGTTRTFERLAASVGQLPCGASVEFESSLDVSNGGVLFALPALLSVGLLRHATTYFRMPRGYYRFDTVMLLLAFMALARLKNIEALRYVAPGEWGKLVGMDRIPEVRTLRKKLKGIIEGGEPEVWAARLCQEWMEASPEQAQLLYVDGHVRVYHGHQTPLPRHYVARQKMALHATTDYWVNALDGQPFLLMHYPIDPGLIQVLREGLLPWLEREVPSQPTAEALDADPWLHRFTIVFDREGYSPELFEYFRQHRVASLTYHKYPGDPWPDDEFTSTNVTLASGEMVEMPLAERGVQMGKTLWVREIRKCCASGHQTSILSLDYRSDRAVLAAAMFARWSQENYFKYMREQYSLDGLMDYGTTPIPDGFQVVNPAYRKLDNRVRSQVAKLSRKKAEFGALGLEGDIEPTVVERYQQEMATRREEIVAMQREVDQLKDQRKATERYVDVQDLPPDTHFDALQPYSKHFIDTIKMVAYRAETAMAGLIKDTMAHPDEARHLLRAIYDTEADILPNPQQKILTIRLHHLAQHCADRALKRLCEVMNATETVFPGTNMRLVYELVS